MFLGVLPDKAGTAKSVCAVYVPSTGQLCCLMKLILYEPMKSNGADAHHRAALDHECSPSIQWLEWA